MIKQSNKPWYIARRAELMAEQFLIDLEPSSLSPMTDLGVGTDYLAFFSRADGAPIAVAVEVKATEKIIKEYYPLPSPQALKLLRMNIPVLLLVVDVKDNQVYFNWIKDGISAEQKELLNETSSCKVRLRPSTSDELQKLKQEIGQQ